jgi:hypothetical protein
MLASSPTSQYNPRSIKLKAEGVSQMALTLDRVQAFIKEPKHWMPLLGAFIVFVTFIVKEGFRDHWKDDASALETAQYIYGVQSQARSIQVQIEQINGAISKTFVSVAATPF